ncbi:MAG: hypothetical protein MJ237_05130 [bacterium]|nr:hypothetical protein [bacterium]
MVDSISMINGNSIDPYFMQAYCAPNPQAEAYYAQMAAAAATAQPTVADSSVTFKGTGSATDNIKESTPAKKKSCTGKIIGAVLAIATTVFGIKAHKAGTGKNGIKKIFNGAKTIFNNFFKKSAGKVHNPKEFTMREINGQTVCTVPGRRNVVKEGDITATLNDLGVNTSNLQEAITKRQAILKDYSFTMDGNEIFVNNGKITKILNPQKEVITSVIKKSTNESDITFLRKVNDQILSHQNGNNIENLKNIRYKVKQDGTTILCDKDGKITMAISERFKPDSQAVEKFKIDNPNYKGLIEDFSTKKDGFAIKSAEYQPSGISETILIKDGKVFGIQKDGKIYSAGSDEFTIFNNKNKEAIENALKEDAKKNYTNIIYGIT